MTVSRLTVCSSTVASFAEAWIENSLLPIISVRFSVASFAEAWIEKCRPSPTPYSQGGSPPSRRRGLKIECIGNIADDDVASFAEAWIENAL